MYVMISFRKILVSAKLFVRNSGAGNGCGNFMDAWKNAFFLQEKPMSIEFLVLGGGGGGVFWVFFWGGGSADFTFMGARNFLSLGIWYLQISCFSLRVLQLLGQRVVVVNL